MQHTAITCHMLNSVLHISKFYHYFKTLVIKIISLTDLLIPSVLEINEVRVPKLLLNLFKKCH